MTGPQPRHLAEFRNRGIELAGITQRLDEAKICAWHVRKTAGSA
jgi:hypothetical protein